MTDFEPWRTVGEVAEFLRLSPRHIRRMAKAGELPAVMVAGNYRFKLSRIERVMQTKNVKVAA